MVKDLKRWVGRETTLTVGEKTYHGKIVTEHYFNPLKNGNHYYFQTNNGEKTIPINTKHVKFKNGGLELKLNN